METHTLIKPTADIYMWVEQGSSVMVKALTSFGDPVKLTADEVLKVIGALQLSLQRLREGNAQERVDAVEKPMTNWKRGDLVEFDGLLAVIVGVVGDPDVPDDHVAVWMGEPKCIRRSQGGSGGQNPEIWTVPVECITIPANSVVKH